MKSSRACDLFFVILLFFSAYIPNRHRGAAAQPDSKPLVKRPEGTHYKTLLSVDGGGIRGIVAVVVIIEVEQSIKRYLLAHPELLPADAGISDVDDFDINLADYFDCMTGLSSGTWAVLYLASRGGQVASRAMLDDPVIVGEYGVIPTGGAEGLRVFFLEYSSLMYPPVNNSIFASENPLSPSVAGVLTPVYTLDGLETALGVLLGNSTLSDMDTSFLVSTYDLMTGVPVFFVQNAFRDSPVSSTGRLLSRTSPQRTPGDGRAFLPDFVFDEGKDYYLADIGTAAGNALPLRPAKQMSPVNNDTVEFVLVDGIVPVQYASQYASFFLAAENNLSGFENIAILNIGNGYPLETPEQLANSGIAEWLDNFNLVSLFFASGQFSSVSLLDYMFYANPNTKPNQYLNVQMIVPEDSEDFVLLSSTNQPEFLGGWEAFGTRMAETYRDSIDAFVRDFIFG